MFWKLKTDGSGRRFSGCLLRGEATRTRTFAVSGTAAATPVFGVPCERRKGGRRDGQRLPGAPAGFPHCLRSRCYDRKKATRGLAEPKTPQGKETIQDLVVYFFYYFFTSSVCAGFGGLSGVAAKWKKQYRCYLASLFLLVSPLLSLGYGLMAKSIPLSGRLV